MQDEIYIEQVLLYHGGTLFIVFGRATDNPQSLVQTVLGVMISCMFRGPIFISKCYLLQNLIQHFFMNK